MLLSAEEDAFTKEYHLWMLAESVSQFSLKFKMQPVLLCLKENA